MRYNMANQKKEKKKTQQEINKENLQEGLQLIRLHPLFGALLGRIHYKDSSSMGKNSYCFSSSDGTITVNESVCLPPKHWAYVIAHNLLHSAFGHFDADKMPGYLITDMNGSSRKKVECIPELWNMACDIYITKFLYDIKFSSPIHENPMLHFPGSLKDEQTIYAYLVEHETSAKSNLYSTSAVGTMDMRGLDQPLTYDRSKNQHNIFTSIFSHRLAYAVSQAVSIAGGHSSQDMGCRTNASQAANWFINHYPLLGGVAAHFKLIEDHTYCCQNEIQIAAVDTERGELYVNPASDFSLEEWKFVLAHEYLHAGLQHSKRCLGRDPYLWNVACDFVINSWLLEMQIGKMPANGLLYDETLAGFSAETIYDMIEKDIRRYAKLDTFRGYGKRDIIDSSNRFANGLRDTVNLDEFCRCALQQGLEYHETHERGLLPAALIEEIRALSMPPIPWDVELGNWFQAYFSPLEKYRSYARPSRRQASTPDIPRPRYVPQGISTDSRTFGVVLDTSRSMTEKQIAMALGSIASYAAAHDVPFARVVFCDAAAYDAGYLTPEEIAGKVLIKGRGGTILQPGINLLEHAADFPKNGPILIITDGGIEEKISITHEHAWLLPHGRYSLPFRTKAPVFRFKE